MPICKGSEPGAGLFVAELAYKRVAIVSGIVSLLLIAVVVLMVAKP